MRLPGASTFCPWQVKMEVWWSGGVLKLASVVLLEVISNQKQFQNLRLQNEQNNELKVWVNLVDKVQTLRVFWASIF